MSNEPKLPDLPSAWHFVWSALMYLGALLSALEDDAFGVFILMSVALISLSYQCSGLASFGRGMLDYAGYWRRAYHEEWMQRNAPRGQPQMGSGMEATNEVRTFDA